MSIEWRGKILQQLECRKAQQTTPYGDLVSSHNKLLESATILRIKNSELELQTYKYKQEILELQHKVALGGSSEHNSEVSGGDKGYEQKIYKLQEELTELHRTKGENITRIIQLGQELKKKDEELSQKEAEILDTNNNVEALKIEAKKLQNVAMELEATNQTLKDEFQALQLSHNSIEEKLRKSQEENGQLVARWLQLKAEDADRINMENQRIANKHQNKLKKELEDAAKEPLNPLGKRSSSVPNSKSCDDILAGQLGPQMPQFVCVTRVPDRPHVMEGVHDGEITAIRFSVTGKYFVTGGSDRKVKVWELGRGTGHEVATLNGCGASVMCARFDLQEKLILAASNDQACRVWTFNDQRIRHALTGHTGKVLASKFLGEDSSKIVSGSHDRTLKLWDLRSKVCTKTIFAGSSCNDLVTSDLAGTSIISGHFDKKIRFWDVRSDQVVNELQLQGKLTSLDLAPDMSYLLSCTRDDSLKLIDLRMNKIVATFRSEGFKVAFDYTRACFSPDAQYAVCGSHDGGLYVWNAKTNLLEKVLREHKSAVIGTSWHPHGNTLISADRSKTVVLWTDL